MNYWLFTWTVVLPTASSVRFRSLLAVLELEKRDYYTKFPFDCERGLLVIPLFVSYQNGTELLPSDETHPMAAFCWRLLYSYLGCYCFIGEYFSALMASKWDWTKITINHIFEYLAQDRQLPPDSELYVYIALDEFLRLIPPAKPLFEATGLLQKIVEGVCKTGFLGEQTLENSQIRVRRVFAMAGTWFSSISAISAGSGYELCAIELPLVSSRVVYSLLKSWKYKERLSK
jgi:hypothetical protein